VPKAVDREFPLKPDPDRFGANPHPRKGQFGFNFSSLFATRFQNQATSATVGARFGRAARPANNSFTKFEFNQAWLAES